MIEIATRGKMVYALEENGNIRLIDSKPEVIPKDVIEEFLLKKCTKCPSDKKDKKTKS